tara:strand:+ start:473 stop:625 length:153 start_codon:yes stop_codon:yes gene_type:complete
MRPYKPFEVRVVMYAKFDIEAKDREHAYEIAEESLGDVIPDDIEIELEEM